MKKLPMMNGMMIGSTVEMFKIEFNLITSETFNQFLEDEEIDR